MRIDGLCGVCGKQFVSYIDGAKYCSQKCYHEAREGMKRPDVTRRLMGAGNPRWNGGKRICNNGYVAIRTKGHPYSTKDGYVMEHRLVVEKSVGRYLNPEEKIHHKDGDVRNNSVENLELFSGHSQHMKKHHMQILGQKRRNKFKECKYCGRTNVVPSTIDTCHKCYQYRWQQRQKIKQSKRAF